MVENVSKVEKKLNVVENVVALCARRGLVFPTADVYGGFAGFFDFGPVGVELKRNIVNSWWSTFVTKREDVVGIDGSIITNPLVWKASGHLDSFTDPLVDCKKCKTRYRADQLIEDELKLSVDGIAPKQLEELIAKHKLVCPKCKGELTEVRIFNLMFSTQVGVLNNEESKSYLRPETAQSIFTAFKTIHGVSRKQLPYGIAQVGKAFRNEIAPRNFLFRCREFEQAEIEYFVNPEKMDECEYFAKEHENFKAIFYTAEMQEKKKEHKELKVGDLLEEKVIGNKWHAYWLVESMKWLTDVIGLKKENLRFRQHVKTELSHYSSETWDIEYNYPWGWKELQGIANRGNFDLTQHAKHSGKEITVFDEATKQRLVPFVIEPSIGIGRLLFTVLVDAFYQKEEKGEVKNVLRFSTTVAPVKVAVFPLMKKDGLAEKAREVFEKLKATGLAVEYDESGSIGKRYARQDEIGTPFCITIDYDSLEKDDVTLRVRDSGEQERVKISKIAQKCIEMCKASV
ncbi:MAG: glycine--tRNA ligase [Candidatus Micrarchaeota archaeon]